MPYTHKEYDLYIWITHKEYELYILIVHKEYDLYILITHIEYELYILNPGFLCFTATDTIIIIETGIAVMLALSSLNEMGNY